MSNELIILEKLNPVEIYTGGLNATLEKLAQEARALQPDISTEKGRKEIASNAYKVARSKTFLDDMGKVLGEEAKAKLDAINADRKKARDFLDALKDEVRKPLTDWENAEKKRVEDHETTLMVFSQNLHQDATIEQIDALIKTMNDAYEGRDWEEFKMRVDTLYKNALQSLNESKERRVKYDTEQAELARLREEEIKRQQKEHEAKIAAEAANKARIEAEAKAAQELAAQKDAEEKAKRDALEAEERAKKAAEALAAAEAKAKADAEEAAKRAEREKQLAVEQERKRAEAEAKAQADAAIAREKDKAHKSKINNDVLTELQKVIAASDQENLAKNIVIALAQQKIPHVKISY